MKRSLSLVLAFALPVLSMGPAAPSAAAQVAAASRINAPAARVSVLPTLSPALGMPGGALSLNKALTAPSLTASPALLAAPAIAAPAAVAAPVAVPAPAGALAAIYRTAEGNPTPFALTMSALSAAAVETKDMGDSQSRETAGKDFQNRIGQSEGEVELLLSAPEGAGQVMTEDVYPFHLAKPGVSLRSQGAAMERQLEKLGVSPRTLEAHNARAIGAVSKINTAVLKVNAADADLLKAVLEAQGLKVQRGRIFEVPKPQAAEPSARSVGLKEMSRIINADKLQAELAKVLGDPDAKPSFLARAKAWVGKLLGATVENPKLPWAVLDTWVAATHPYLAGRFTKNVDNNADSETHGTHTASTVIGVDRWNFEGRNYNIFPGGSASESDILFKMNMAQEDGAVGTTHSWGDGSGNPAGAIEKLFVKGAESGIHHSVSAGNAGSRANTIGGPAIAVYTTDLVINGKVIGKVERIKAVAASDADKKTAYFSSRGPGSRITSTKPEYKDYPQKPDESGVGVNLIAAVPTGSNVAELGGPGAAMSGTSMSNPGVFGAFLLLTRGILVLLKDGLPEGPSAARTQLAMDIARYAMTQTAEKVAGPNEVGDGFINVWAAFEYAAKLLKP
ncbi:MAG: S8 family serine peptidase [Elusimicrobiota bacterium]|nr:S8 family serine peptidase [Elusimicrobiota bacterium]